MTQFKLFSPGQLMENNAVSTDWIIMSMKQTNMFQTEYNLFRRYAFYEDARQGMLMLNNGIDPEIVLNWQHGESECAGDPEPRFRYKRWKK